MARITLINREASTVMLTLKMIYRMIYVSRIALKAVNITIINHIRHLEQTRNSINLTLKLCKMQ